MYKINERKAGDFIDLCNYFGTMDGNEELITKFYLLLIGRLPTTIEEVDDIVLNFAIEVEEIKNGFEFVYNPPSLPSSIEQTTPTIGDEYIKEFAEMYGGYPSLTFLIAKTFNKLPEEVMEMKTQDFLFWGNFLLHQQFVEKIK